MQLRPTAARKQHFDAFLRRFLSRLHAHLLSRGRCFVSGSFVVEIPAAPRGLQRDAASVRFKNFLDNLTSFSSRRLLAKTHDDFQRPAKLAAHRLCADRCTGDARTLRAGPQYEYLFSPPLSGLCGGQDVYAKGVLLWYTFSLGAQRFLFLKLESHGATSPAHAKAAFMRYVLKRGKKTPFETRRENAYKDGKGPIRDAAAAAAARNVAALWPQHAAAAGVYDATLRTGMELFVPAAAAAQML